MQRAKDKRTKRGAWRVLKRLSHDIKHKMSNINHCIAKELVLMAKERRYGIAIENLKGLRHRKVGRRHRKRLHKWAYRDLSLQGKVAWSSSGVRKSKRNFENMFKVWRKRKSQKQMVCLSKVWISAR